MVVELCAAVVIAYLLFAIRVLEDDNSELAGQLERAHKANDHLRALRPTAPIATVRSITTAPRFGAICDQIAANESKRLDGELDESTEGWLS